MFLCRFHRDFIRNSSYQVDFKFGRTPLKVMHRAVGQAAPYLDMIPFHGQPSGMNDMQVERLSK